MCFEWVWDILDIADVYFLVVKRAYNFRQFIVAIDEGDAIDVGLVYFNHFFKQTKFYYELGYFYFKALVDIDVLVGWVEKLRVAYFELFLMGGENMVEDYLRVSMLVFEIVEGTQNQLNYL